MADSFQVGEWFVEPDLNSLSANGNTIHLEPKIMQVLVCLAAHSNKLVSKERLIRTVWAETFVGDDVLTRSISELRRCFGDDPKEPQFIETIPKSGYRLIAPVSFANDKQGPTTRVMTPDSPRSEWFSGRLIIACLLVAGLVAAALYIWNLKRPSASAKSNSMRSIVVLPF